MSIQAFTVFIRHSTWERVPTNFRYLINLIKLFGQINFKILHNNLKIFKHSNIKKNNKQVYVTVSNIIFPCVVNCQIKINTVNSVWFFKCRPMSNVDKILYWSDFYFKSTINGVLNRMNKGRIEYWTGRITKGIAQTGKHTPYY